MNQSERVCSFICSRCFCLQKKTNRFFYYFSCKNKEKASNEKTRRGTRKDQDEVERVIKLNYLCVCFVVLPSLCRCFNSINL